MKKYIKDTFETSFVNKYGIASYCDYHPKSNVSDIEKIDEEDYRNILSGSLVYVVSSALKDWFNKIYPELVKKNRQIILVTGDSIINSPLQSSNLNINEFMKLKNQGIIYHWFCQNCDIDLPEYVSPIPVGIDYHTIHKSRYWGEYKTHYILQDIYLNLIGRKKFEDFHERKNNLFCDIHLNKNIFQNKALKDRNEFYLKSLNLENTFYLKKKVSRLDYWKKMRSAKFIGSPRGFGEDCHRTWEALSLGVVPIIKYSKINILFDNLPVIIIKSFNELNNDLLNNYKLPNNLNLESLTLQYWQNIISDKKLKLINKLNFNSRYHLKKQKKFTSINLNKNFFIVLFYNLRKNKSILISIIYSILKKFLLPYSLLKFFKNILLRAKNYLLKNIHPM